MLAKLAKAILDVLAFFGESLTCAVGLIPSLGSQDQKAFVMRGQVKFCLYGSHPSAHFGAQVCGWFEFGQR